MGKKINQAELDKQAMMSALSAALRDKSERLFGILVAGGLDDDEAVYAASRCVIDGRKSFLSKLVATRDDWSVVEGAGSLMRDAAIHGASAMAKILASNGFPLDEPGPEGSSALMAAAARGHVDIVRLLASKGADIDRQGAQDSSWSGWCPLHLAALAGHVRMAKVLVEMGANPNFAQKEGLTPLMMAAKSTSAMEEGDAFCEVLIKGGADVAAVDKNGYTAAMWAARARNDKMLEALLAVGIDKDQTRPSDGKSLLEVALEPDVYGARERCAQLLLEAGVEPPLKVKLTKKGRLVDFSALAKKNGYMKVHETLEAKKEAGVIGKALKGACALKKERPASL